MCNVYNLLKNCQEKKKNSPYFLIVVLHKRKLYSDLRLRNSIDSTNCEFLLALNYHY